MPLVVVVGIEENQTAGEVRIHELEGECSRQGSKERPPHHFVGKVVRYLHNQTHSVYWQLLDIKSYSIEKFLRQLLF